MSIIREYREKNGLTQTELATKLKTNQNTISRWEAGMHPAYVVELFKLIKGAKK